MSYYPTRRLCDVGVTLLDCEHRTPKASPVGYPYVAIPNIKEGRLDLSEVRLISKEDFESWTKKTKPLAGDIIITRRARVGDTAVVPLGLDCAIGQNLVILRSDGSKLDQSYLRWALQGPIYEEQVRKFMNVGAVFDSLNCADIPKFEIPVPPLPEQRAIARILGTLDDKIEANRRMNETLEAMARAIFKSWFVDFDPVRAKAEGREPAGMDTETAALFPDCFEETELGMVPKGWKLKSLDEIADFLNGLAMQKFPPESEDFLPVIKIAELHRGNTIGSDRASLNIDPRYIIEDGDLLFSWSGSLEVCIWCGGEGALNQHLFKVTSTEYPMWFLYFWLKEHLPEFQLIAAGKATTMGHIQRYHLSEAKVVIPITPLLEKADNITQPLLRLIIKNNLEFKDITSIRDILLPKLLSGEIRAIATGRY
jgi:type I restriction enzyme, S subunit